MVVGYLTLGVAPAWILDGCWRINTRLSFVNLRGLCDRSPGKERAIEFPGSDIFFFEDERADFRNWTDVFPFEHRMDAVLANFAVINCIPDIDCLFDKLALALKPGGQVIALILDNHFIMRLRSNTRGTIGSFFSGKSGQTVCTL